jgi:alkanesulfonate monooxygenase SsuD/methylene tetrahydromethanopterin reductase-like flavin-dependent oxidoreductase (luciferase family)
MELGFFTQPIHMHGRSYAETLEEDRDAFVLADRLGFAEAYIGEHMTNKHENVANGLIFVASLAGLTKNIKLGTGVHNLAFSHPLVIASNVAMVDNMLKGRFLFGIGAGITFSDAEALGILDKDRRAMFEEAIEQVLALWEGEPPYDLKGEFWNISTAKTSWPEVGLGEVSKPYQRPHPPIFAGSGDPASQSLAAYGRRGWSILSSDTLPASRLAEQWETYAGGCAEAGRDAQRRNWRVVRSIFVAEDEKTALEYGKTSAESPYRFHFNDFLIKFQRGKRLDMFKADPAIPDEQVTLDYALEHCVIAGTVDQVVEQILAVREAAGPFGTLVYAGKDWVDPRLSRRSMELMAQEVMPAVNAAIGEERWVSEPGVAG